MYSTMFLHLVLMSVYDNAELVNVDENELDLTHKAFGYPSFAIQVGGETHTRTEKGEEKGWEVSHSPEKPVHECQLLSRARFRQ
jgi:hypothetical protein